MKSLQFIEVDVPAFAAFNGDKYVTTFAEFDVGDNGDDEPLGSTWPQFGGDADLLVIAQPLSPSGKALEVSKSLTSEPVEFPWQVPPAMLNMSVVAQLDDIVTETALVARFVDDDNYYETYLSAPDGAIELFAVVGGEQQGTFAVADLPFDIAGQSIWVRLDVETIGSVVQLQAKVWQGERSDEPIEFIVSALDDDVLVPGPGRAGFAIFSDGASYNSGYFSVQEKGSDDQTFRFALPTEYLPRDVDCIPSISAISYTPAIISLGEDLGQRATLSITLKDHRHIMNGEPFDQGTFWGKWRARYGQKLRGRSVRWLNGLEGQALADMQTRHFFIDSVDGPTPDGVYTIVAKDLLKFADDDRAQAPRFSNGRLAGGINDSVGSATLTPTGIGNAEYPAAGHVCIGGKEIVAFTRSGDVLTITRGQLGTIGIAHDANERMQLVLYYDGDDVADIIRDLFVNYAGIDSSFIPLADWQAETAANLGGVIYARPITEPTAVNKLVSELVEQAALAMWWDELARIVKLQVLKEISTDANLWDEDKIIKGSLKVKEQPDKRISEIDIYYGQRNPADRGDNEDNYRAVLVDVDLGKATEYGSTLLRKITGPWVATENAAQRLAQVQLSRFRDPPRRFNFDLFPGAAVTAGTGYRLRWRQNQDVLGNIVEEGAPIQITRLAVEPGVIHIEAEEMLASGSIVLTNTIFLTTTGGVFNWTVPDDWNSADNKIECLGAGGGGAAGGKGAGGGAYSSISNLALTPGASVQYSVGALGLGGFRNPNGSPNGLDGGDTWFNGATLGASSVGAKGGQAGVGRFNFGNGGQASSGIGTVKFSGGIGGNGTNSGGGGGSGAAAGPNGNGGNGGFNSGAQDGGTGGGGSDGGANGQGPSGDTGGQGGNTRFGFGGGSDSIPDGIDGGGGKGSNQGGNPGRGSASQLWTQTIAPIISAGPAGGPGGGSIRQSGRDAVNYGAGGSGAGDEASVVGGNGSQGIIVITWTPA